MRKNKFIIPLIISIFICTLYSCEEQEIQPFSGETAVNFVGKVGNEWYIYEENIQRSYNVYDTIIKNKTFPLESFTVKARLDIEGKTPEKPIKVKLIAKGVEGKETVKVDLPDIVFEPGKTEVYFDIKVYTPKDYNIVTQTRICIDYANSDVVPGTKTRQEFLLLVKDEAEKMFQQGTLNIPENEYIETFEKYLGKYGEVKHRFLAANTPPNPQGVSDFKFRIAYSKLMPAYGEYGLPGALPTYREKLNEYNEKNPNSPLKEKDGTLVELPN